MQHTNPDRAQTLLLACLHQDRDRIGLADLSTLTDTEWHALVALAIRERIAPLLYQRLEQRGLSSAVPDEINRRLHRRYERNALQVLRLYAELNKLARALQDHYTPIILLKGAYLASAVYENIALREMNDLDILVHQNDVDKVANTLISLGYTPQRPFSIAADLQWGLHLPRFLHPTGVGVEIHWNITRPNLHYSIAVRELWRRAVPATIADATVLCLDPEDLLLHLAMHTSYQHRFAMGLRPFYDIAHVVQRFGPAIDWEQVQQRATRWRWRRGVHLAFRLAHDIAGAAVPHDILHDLRPNGFDDTLVAAAKEQAFAKTGAATGIPPGLAQLGGSNSTLEKATQLFKAVFLSPLTLSRVYSVAPGSPRVFLYYPVRLKDVLVRHSRAAWNVIRGDRETVQAAKRIDTLHRWLSE